jgi:3-hydroxybutyryl-CoA dehydrogenase
VTAQRGAPRQSAKGGPEMAEIKTVGVIGAGQMGGGIAHVCALAGYEVLLNDVAPEKIKECLSTIDHNLSRQVARGIVQEIDKREAMARIRPVEKLDDIGGVDLAIVAATENEETKKSIFRALQQHLSPTTLLASNTSSISITRLASVTDRPERFIGLHFMNPVPLMKLVEIIRGIATDASTYEAAVGFAKSLGKTTANAEDFPAFIVNRILVPMINEAIYTLYEGVGSVEAIDTAMRLGANHPMGPLQLADFIGLDTCLSVMQVLHEGLADTKYRPCPLLVKYVEAGWLGKKTQRGFYDYRSGTPTPTR